MMLHNNLDESIQINNRYLGSIRSDKLVAYNPQIPHIQRLCDESKVNDIVLYQSNIFKQNGICNFLGVINIHFCKETGEHYIIDGQHRYEAVKRICREVCNFQVAVEIVVVNSIEEVKENYKILNKNTTLPDFPDTIDKEIPEKTAVYFKERYPTIWSKSSRARRPHIFFDFFQEALGVLTEYLEITTSSELQRIVEDYNLKLSKWNPEQYPDSKTTSVNKCKETGMYLGLFSHVSDEYRYDWVKAIIQLEKGIVIRKQKAVSKKASIPKKIREDAWNTHVGKGKNSVLCVCCRTSVIDVFNFHAGHVKSESNGGSVTVENIRPVCSSCNLSMGIVNMDEYVRNHYPLNVIKFKNVTYEEPKMSTNTSTSKKWNLNIF